MLATRQLLQTFNLFEGLVDRDLDDFCAKSQVRRYSRRSVILSARQDQNQLCLLFEGRLQGIDFTIDGKEVGLYFVEPGDYCGELSVFDHGPQPEHVIALNSAVVILIDAETIRNVALRHPQVMLKLGTKLTSRIRQMTSQRSLLSVHSIPQRVCNQVWMLIRENRLKDSKSVSIVNLPTHMEIAIMLNLSRETVTRVFQQLQRKKLVSRKGPNELLIHDVSTFKAVAEGLKKI